MCLYFANGKRAIQTDLWGIKPSPLLNQTCLATLIRLLQFSKNCCKKQRGVLLFETKSVHVARFTGQGKRQFGSKWLNSHCVWRDSSVILCDVWTWVVKRTILEKENGSKRPSLNPSVTNLRLRPWCYLSTVTRSSSQGSVDGFRRQRLQRFATFHSFLFSVSFALGAKASWSKITNGKENYRVLPRRNLEAIGAVGANLRPFSFDGSVGPLRWSAQSW